MKTLLKRLLIWTSIALLAACGSQDSANSGTNTPIAGVNIDSAAPNNVANNGVNADVKTGENTGETASPTQNTQLLTSLAANYPGGQLPLERTAQAAKDLAQNPAALKQTAPIQAQSFQTEPIQAQATATDYQPVQRIQNTTLYGAYFFSIYAGEVTSALAGNPNWRLEGPAFWASLVTGVDLNPVHRFQNKLNGSYLYTIYDGERANIVANFSATFTYEGIAWYARQTPATGWSALYRFRNKTNGTYLFSAYESEKNAIVANYPEVFELEGIAYYVRQDAPSVACDAAPIVASEPYSLVFKGCSAANVAEYYDKTECVRDNASGLIWQGQTAAGTGLRSNDQPKTNYDSTTALQKYIGTGPAGFIFIAPSQLDVDSSTNSIGYKNAINTSRLCGYSSWRMPTLQELQGVAETAGNESIYDIWFPNVKPKGFFFFGDAYWSSTPSTDFAYAAMVSVLRSGSQNSNPNFRSNINKNNILVRLVHN